MKIDQLGRTIELLRQKLMFELEAYNEAVLAGKSTAQVQPIYAKIKETREKIQTLNAEYEERLNKEIEKFNRLDSKKKQEN